MDCNYGMADDTKSRYPKLELPKFESKIPMHLVNKMSDQEKWLVETISKLDQKTDWLLQKTVDTNEHVLADDVRLTKVEEWKSLFSGKWAVIAGIAFMATTAVASALARGVIEHFSTKGP